jgi:hypothetical protein
VVSLFDSRGFQISSNIVRQSAFLHVYDYKPVCLLDKIELRHSILQASKSTHHFNVRNTLYILYLVRSNAYQKPQKDSRTGRYFESKFEQMSPHFISIKLAGEIRVRLDSVSASG